MAKTVVGLFKSMGEAQSLKNQLVSEGFPAGSIRVVADEGTSSSTINTSSTSPSGARTAAAEEGTGIMASIKNFFGSFTEADETDRDYYSQGVTRGGAILAVTVADERVSAVQARLEQYGASSVSEQSTASGTGTSTRSQATTASTSGDVAIPVVAEELVVGKRQVNRGGVRVYSHLVETPVEESIQLREEHVRVQRNTVDRPASAADFQNFKEGAIELTETGEEAVVGKKARVVEEVTVGKNVSERTETVSDTVRHTEVEVENLAADKTTLPTDKAKRTSGSGK